jgi:hypothetical protein
MNSETIINIVIGVVLLAALVYLARHIVPRFREGFVSNAEAIEEATAACTANPKIPACVAACKGHPELSFCAKSA